MSWPSTHLDEYVLGSCGLQVEVSNLWAEKGGVDGVHAQAGVHELQGQVPVLFGHAALLVAQGQRARQVANQVVLKEIPKDTQYQCY